MSDSRPFYLQLIISLFFFFANYIQEIESHVALAERLGVEIPSSVAREKEGW
jgi:hypothetical protein